jgi:hypothetical protein
MNHSPAISQKLQNLLEELEAFRNERRHRSLSDRIRGHFHHHRHRSDDIVPPALADEIESLVAGAIELFQGAEKRFGKFPLKTIAGGALAALLLRRLFTRRRK